MEISRKDFILKLYPANVMWCPRSYDELITVDNDVPSILDTGCPVDTMGKVISCADCWNTKVVVPDPVDSLSLAKKRHALELAIEDAERRIGSYIASNYEGCTTGYVHEQVTKIVGWHKELEQLSKEENNDSRN